MGLSNKYLAPELLAEKLYLQFLSWISCSSLVSMLRGCFGCQKSVRHAGSCPACASVSAAVQVTNACGQLLPLPHFWLVLFTTARSGNLRGLKRSLLVHGINTRQLLAGARHRQCHAKSLLLLCLVCCQASDMRPGLTWLLG